MLRAALPVLVVLGSVFVYRHVNQEQEFIPLAGKVLEASYDYVIGECCAKRHWMCSECLLTCNYVANMPMHSTCDLPHCKRYERYKSEQQLAGAQH